eukprot:3350315-Prorocentrum_lima.AAC.1
MTSSLVGSEMCIRDSLFLVGVAAPLAAAALLAPLRVPLHPPRAYQRGAVSYTHLTLPTICSV